VRGCFCAGCGASWAIGGAAGFNSSSAFNPSSINACAAFTAGSVVVPIVVSIFRQAFDSTLDSESSRAAQEKQRDRDGGCA